MAEGVQSHPLRFRYDCWRSLTREQFTVVDDALQDAFRKLSWWLDCHPTATDDEIERATGITTAATNDNQLATRNRGAALALIAHGFPAAFTARRFEWPEESASDSAGHAWLTDQEPLRAIRQLVKHLAGGDSNLAHLIGYDQVTPTSLVGRRPPKGIRPLLRALALTGGWRPGAARHSDRSLEPTRLHRPARRRKAAADQGTRCGIAKSRFWRRLARSGSQVTKPILGDVAALYADGILHLEDGAYHATL